MLAIPGVSAVEDTHAPIPGVSVALAPPHRASQSLRTPVLGVSVIVLPIPGVSVAVLSTPGVPVVVHTHAGCPSRCAHTYRGGGLTRCASHAGCPSRFRTDIPGVSVAFFCLSPPPPPPHVAGHVRHRPPQLRHGLLRERRVLLPDPAGGIHREHNHHPVRPAAAGGLGPGAQAQVRGGGGFGNPVKKRERELQTRRDFHQFWKESPQSLKKKLGRTCHQMCGRVTPRLNKPDKSF